MHELGQDVPVIPVITKADTMTIREAQNYKQEARAHEGQGLAALRAPQPSAGPAFA